MLGRGVRLDEDSDRWSTANSAHSGRSSSYEDLGNGCRGSKDDEGEGEDSGGRRTKKRNGGGGGKASDTLSDRPDDPGPASGAKRASKLMVMEKPFDAIISPFIVISFCLPNRCVL